MSNDNDNYEEKRNRRNSSNRIKLLIITLGFVVTSLVSVYLGHILTSKGILPITNDKAIQQSLEGINDVSEFKKLFDVRESLYRYYDGEIDDSALVDGAIKGMTLSLKDPYTYYMNAEDYNNYKEKSESNYYGLGLVVAVRDNKLVVKELIEGSPAAKAGILPDDIILKINDVSFTGEDLNKAVSIMKGKEKVDVKLTLSREDKGVFDQVVTRDIVNIINIKGEMLNDTMGYIKINSFDKANTAKDFNASLKDLQSKGMKGLILDLRSNPGGYMRECVDVVSNFIPKDQVIVSTIDKYKKEEKSLSKGGMAIGMPLVVLTNKDTASASEIVAGAVRDYKIGTLVGTTTYGKGVVQVILDNKDDGSSLKVTISKYYTPNGENIHKVGIKPDVEVEYPKELEQEKYDRVKDLQFQKALEVLKDKVK